MRSPARAGPGAFELRRARAASLDGTSDAAEPMGFLHAVLEHQARRAQDPAVQGAAQTIGSEALPNRLIERFPLLDLAASIDAIPEEVDSAVAVLADGSPGPLVASGRDLLAQPSSQRRDLVATWLDDTTLVDPRVALWIRVASGPLLELAAARLEPVGREEWTGRACPICGDVPQCSAIVEESGAFMQGAPRYLVCGRCSSWWAFPRATCSICEEDDSTKLGSFFAEDRPWARVDVCDSCMGYIKTFDLREKQARDVLPLVDDVATVALDVWAHEKGLSRAGLSLAGV